ncbi:kinase-like domain-containing protein [Pyronema domesticum]|uniref:Similar to Dual specificity protein kinase FUZ7 acc. no. Q99078 n=1 Tax=Pyronema omphalodes (strain CBS 100304) TaxID=1076935 RepID=U4LQZ9_PYROM|nr:kinase-like domain-containing protein [Pyronema domesticum]CCX33994.1 Similar to Dual specificity protein kinase FUZ7; acc. no. Q99078 [Pyronema omphalodes CBS 100304]
MSDEASGLKVKSLKRKNVKGLMIKSEPKKEPAPQQVAGGDDYQASLTGQLSSLEIGVEFKLDLRAEDLQVINELGAGNGGTVSKVLHKTLKTVMAKKVIHIDAKPTVRKQIVRELHIMHECHSPYIVSFYGAFLNEGDVVMCMEYMDCGSLDNIAKKIGPIRIDVLGKISEAVVEGLHYLYNEHKILHRDIKPSNILVNSRGQIKLCDFGVSGELINSIANTFVGTSTYMAPERIKGAQYSVKSDVWSLGLSLLELAIGRFPFDADGSSAGTRASAGPMGILDLLQKIVNEPAPRLPKNAAFPRSLELMIEHCLIKDPDQRPSPEDLLSEPFMRSAKATNVDLEGWACELMEKLTGKPHQRSRSSVSINTPVLQQAPARPTSRIDGMAPPPPRRPSAVGAESRRSSAVAEQSPTGDRRQNPVGPFPARTSSHVAGHERTGSDHSRINQMAPPPPPTNKVSSRPPIHKSYTESSSMTSLEAQREREKFDREAERERQRQYAFRQGTIGIGFEGSVSSSKDSPTSDKPEMKEKRRAPMTTMTSSGNAGVGIANGYDRR